MKAPTHSSTYTHTHPHSLHSSRGTGTLIFIAHICFSLMALLIFYPTFHFHLLLYVLVFEYIMSFCWNGKYARQFAYVETQKQKGKRTRKICMRIKFTEKIPGECRKLVESSKKKGIVGKKFDNCIWNWVENRTKTLQTLWQSEHKSAWAQIKFCAIFHIVKRLPVNAPRWWIFTKCNFLAVLREVWFWLKLNVQKYERF